MPSKRRSTTAIRLLLTFALVSGLLIAATIPASAVGNTVDLSVTLAQPTGDATAGLTWAYDVKVANGGPDASTGYTASFDAIPGTSLASAPGCFDNGETIDCTSTGLANGSDETFTITLDVSPSYVDNTPLDASVAITDTNDDTNTSTQTSAIATTQVQRVADLGIVKSGPEGLDPSVVAGDPAGFDYTLTVGTAGPSDTDYTTSDTLASGLTFQTVGSDPGCAATGQVVTCDGSIAAGADPVALTIHVLVDPSAPHSSILENDASVAVTGGTEDSNDANDSTSGPAVSTTITAHADLGLSVSATSGDNVAGDPAGVDFTYTVSNDGPSDNVGGFTITDTLPAGFAFKTSGTSTACAAAGQAVTCEDPSDFPQGGEEHVFTVHTTIASSVEAGTYNDAAAVAPGTSSTTGTQDPNGLNDMDSAGVEVITRADMEAVSKTASPTTIRANDTAFNTTIFTIEVTNNGFSDAQAVDVSDELPTEFESATYCTGTGCTPGTAFTGSVTLGKITAAASSTVRIAAVADESLRGGPKVVTNTASVSSSTIDPNIGNETATSGDVRIETVPNPPTNVIAFPGNGSAVVTWVAPAGPGANGGSPITGYRVTVTSPNVGTIPAGSPFFVTGTQFAIGDDTGAGVLSNNKKYVFEVRAVNVVGDSDLASSNEITPTQDLSAEIFSPANQDQQTGEGAPSANDKMTAKQSQNFKNGSIGTIEEVFAGSANTYGIDPSTFCGGLPCIGGEVVVTKVNDVATGRFLIDILVAKGVATGTGKKDVYFDPTPDTPAGVIKLASCPKNFSGANANIAACIVKLTRQPAANPDLRLQLSVHADLTDPATGLRR